MSSAKNSCRNASQIASFSMRFILGGTIGDQDRTVRIAAERRWSLFVVRSVHDALCDGMYIATVLGIGRIYAVVMYLYRLSS